MMKMTFYVKDIMNATVTHHDDLFAFFSFFQAQNGDD